MTHMAKAAVSNGTALWLSGLLRSFPLLVFPLRRGNLNTLFAHGSYIAEPANRQAHVCLVKITVLLRMVRIVGRLNVVKKRYATDDSIADVLEKMGGKKWSGRVDLNHRLHGPEPCALPS